MQILNETYGDAGFMSVEADELFLICGGSVNSVSQGYSPPQGYGKTIPASTFNTVADVSTTVAVVTYKTPMIAVPAGLVSAASQYLASRVQ